MDRMEEAFEVWATLTGSRNRWDLEETVHLIRRLVNRPVSLYWPAPYGQPEQLKSSDFDEFGEPHYRYRIHSAVFPDIAPELTVKEEPLPPELSRLLLDALAERWRKVWWESTEALDQVWNSLWLAIHSGRRTPEDLYELLTHGAETVTRAPVICLAVRRAGYHVLEVVSTRGLRYPATPDPLPVSRGLGGFVAENQEGIVVHDYDAAPWRDPRELALIRAESLYGGMVVPWQAMDGVDGVLYAWFRKPGAPSPLALYAFQRYVRSIRAVVLSAQTASRYSFSASLARYAEDPRLQSLLRVLRLARRQGSWDTLLVALADHGVWIQLTDTWGHVLRQSAESPLREPTRTVALEGGLETTLLTVWGNPDLIAAIYPHFIQTLALLIHHDATEHDAKMKKLEAWLRVLLRMTDERRELWQQRHEWDFAPIVNQIWGLQITQSQALTWAGRALLRAVRRKFETQPIIQDHTIWVLTPKVFTRDDLEPFRQYLTTQLSKPVSLVGTHADDDPEVVVAAIRRVVERFPEAEGATLFLGRPNLHQLFRLPELDTSVKLFVDAWIGPLIRYDDENGTDLVATLAACLAAPHLAAAARILFVHPNTVRYRLEQIGDLLSPLDLKDPATRGNLFIACQAWQTLKAGPNIRPHDPKPSGDSGSGNMGPTHH